MLFFEENNGSTNNKDVHDTKFINLVKKRHFWHISFKMADETQLKKRFLFSFSREAQLPPPSQTSSE